MVKRTLHSLLFTLPLVALAACAPKAPALPSGDGIPFAEFAAAHAEATGGCRNVKTFSAVLSLSGRVGEQKMRGRVDAGLEAPDRLVLEATAPWGKPYFILAAQGGDATLVLPRDERVLRGAAPEAIVEALTGVSLTPAELRAVLAGCGVLSAQPSAGRTFDKDWAAVDAGDTTLWLRQVEGKWRVAAAVRGRMHVHYSDFGPNRPSTVRVRVSAPGRNTADLTLRLSDVETNSALDAAVFKIDVPPAARPLTLDDLRRSGPLGERSQ